MEIFLFIVAAICFIFAYLGFKERKQQSVAEKEEKQLKIIEEVQEKEKKDKYNTYESIKTITYIETKNNEPEELIKRVNTFVVGLKYEGRQGKLTRIINELKRNDGFMYEPYDGMTNKEILEDGFSVYEISTESLPDTRIIKEDNNQFDKNALMVYISDFKGVYHHIGYIPKERCIEIREMMDKYKVLIGSSISGGKYKDIDYDDYGNEKVKTFNSDYGIDLSISFWEKDEDFTGNIATSLPVNIASSPTKINDDKLKYTKARKLVEDYTVIDFETTGLDYKTSKIIQVAAVKYKNHERIDEFTTNINPEEKLSSRIKSITGLTDKDLVDAPLITEVLPELIDFISGQTLVAHNASFDMKFLLHNINLCKLPYKKYRVIDTLGLARKNIATDNHKLVTLKDYLQLNHLDSHNALHDCYVAAEVYKYCYEKSVITQ